MQIINHEEQHINYSIKQSNSRINVGTWREMRKLPTETECGITKKNQELPLSQSCGPAHPELSKTTVTTLFHLTKFKDDFGNTWYFFLTKLIRSLYLISSVFASPTIFHSVCVVLFFVITTLMPHIWSQELGTVILCNYQLGQILSLGIHYLHSIRQIDQAAPTVWDYIIKKAAWEQAGLIWSNTKPS